MTLWLKFLFYLNGKFFDLKKTPFRYYWFSVSVNVFLWDRPWVKVFVSQVWIQVQITEKKYNSVVISETLGHFKLHFWSCHSQ